MAVPSRTFVGVTVFGLIAALVVVPYTLLVLTGYEPPPDAPYQVLFPDDGGHSAGDKAFLALASLASVILVAFGWRSLLHAARRDRAIRQLIADGKVEPRRDEEPGAPPPPPGYQ